VQAPLEGGFDFPFESRLLQEFPKLLVEGRIFALLGNCRQAEKSQANGEQPDEAASTAV
jgi:hypothetical protein